MYRIGCLRDDVIFFIFLYQRWVYRVDPSRMNEYGYSKEMLEKKKNQAGAANGDAPAAVGDTVGDSVAEQVVAGETVVTDAPPSTRQRKPKSSRVRKEE